MGCDGVSDGVYVCMCEMVCMCVMVGVCDGVYV